VSDVYPTAPPATVTRLEPDAVPAEVVDQLRAGAIVARADRRGHRPDRAGTGRHHCFQGLLTNDIEKPGDGACRVRALLSPRG